MLQLISLVIFLLSTLLIALILNKKIPALNKLSRNGHHGIKKAKFILDMEKRFKDFHFNFFRKQVFFHKMLSKLRIWVLRTERKISELLQGLREKAQELDKQAKRKR